MYFAISICYNPDICKCCENGKINKIRTRATRKEQEQEKKETRGTFLNKNKIKEQKYGEVVE